MWFRYGYIVTKLKSKADVLVLNTSGRNLVRIVQRKISLEKPQIIIFPQKLLHAPQ